MKKTSSSTINILRLSIQIIVLFCILFPFSGNAQLVQYNHPELQWETIETEHFLVHFHSGLSRTPRLIAKIAEEIYSPVTILYNYEPDTKIHFIIRDHDDYSNGAAYYTDNKIEIWASPLDFLLRGTNEWLRNVVTHEFTHMIQLQAGMKISRRLPAMYIQNFEYEDEKRDDVLYGFPNRLISYPIPGTVMPMWLAEGTAQYGSRMTGNDSWDAHRDMILRMHALSNGVYSLDDMSVFGKSSIGNESVYNHGFAFTLYLVDRFGEDIQEKISRAMRSPLVISFEKALDRAVGVNGGTVHKEWKQELEHSYRGNTERILSNQVQGTLLEARGTSNVFPAWSPDGTRFAYLSNNRSDYLTQTSLYLQDNNSEDRKRLKVAVQSPPAWNPSGDKLYYAKIEKNENSSFFYELFEYDIAEKKERQLTDSRRVTYPSTGPDGRTVYYVSGADGIFNLYAMDIESSSHRKITEFTGSEEIFNSSVSPDGETIAFALSTGFGRDIAIMNTDGSGFRYLLQNEYDERDPVFSPDGSKIYYSSGKTGIFNIYEYDLSTGLSRPVTNVAGGAFMPSINEKGQLLYSLYSSQGYKIARIDTLRYCDPETMSYTSPVGTGTPEIRYDDSRAPQYETRKYDLQYMTTFILPRVVIDYGKPKIGLYSFSSDALDKYSIFLGGGINKDLDRDLFALFDFRTFRQTVFLELYNLTRHTSFHFPAEKRTDDIVLGFWEVDVGFREKISETQNYEFRTLYGRQSANYKPNFAGILIPSFRYDYYKGLNFALKWEYNGILPRLDMDINPSYGRRITIEYMRNYDKIFEDFVLSNESGIWHEVYKKYSYNKLTVDWREYLGLPFIHERSALGFQFNGGYIDKNVDDFLYFFAGGLTGLKGYSFYSLEGRKMMIGTVTFRTPVIQKIGVGWGPWYFDKLYASIGYQAGDAWSTRKLSAGNLKTGIDLGLRLDMFSFYTFPTKIGFNAAYGFDRFHVANRMEGQTWKYFFTVLFGYDF
ncbi:hypothetical protein ACFL6L_01835 [candidate division KSB1 bacterium]